MVLIPGGVVVVVCLDTERERGDVRKTKKRDCAAIEISKAAVIVQRNTIIDAQHAFDAH